MANQSDIKVKVYCGECKFKKEAEVSVYQPMLVKCWCLPKDKCMGTIAIKEYDDYDHHHVDKRNPSCEEINKNNDCPYFQAIAIDSPKPKEKSWFKRIFSR